MAEARAEREVLLSIAPHIIWPLEFVLPHEPHLRPAWMIRLGLFLYDHIGGRTQLPKSRGVALCVDGAGAGLKPEFRRGFSYSDGWVDDARLVVLNARSAATHGATVLPRTRCSVSRLRSSSVMMPAPVSMAPSSERCASSSTLVPPRSWKAMAAPAPGSSLMHLRIFADVPISTSTRSIPPTSCLLAVVVSKRLCGPRA